jgi:small GTP-binding protein
MGGCLSIDSMHDDNPVVLPSTTASQTTSGNQQKSIFAEQQDHFFKVLLLGDMGVGKSSLLMRLTDNTFSETHTSTVGVDFRSKNLKVDSQNVNLQIWDTAGQERYRSITTAYYRGAHGVLLIFDITLRSSFQNLQKWLSDVHKHSHDKTQIILVGNKKDLASMRCVTSEEAQSFAKELGLSYVELSAKSESAKDVQAVFEEIARKILKNDQE